MSTGYSWEGIRQVRATLFGVRHIPERLCGGYVYLGRAINSSARPLPFTFCKCAVRPHMYTAQTQTQAV